jgi:membrane protease YdiL (CAAX protease family)
VPFLLLAVPGIENSWNLNPHLFPIVAMGLLGFISIIGEDMGWSLFLKNALIHLSPLKRSILIGVLWELWHFTNRTAHKTPIHAIASVSIMMAFLIALTLVLNKITDRTKSLITAITIHMWINVLAENGSPAVYIVFGISLVFWTIMYLKWDHPIWRTKKSTDYLS